MKWQSPESFFSVQDIGGTILHCGPRMKGDGRGCRVTGTWGMSQAPGSSLSPDLDGWGWEGAEAVQGGTVLIGCAGVHVCPIAAEVNSWVEGRVRFEEESGAVLLQEEGRTPPLQKVIEVSEVDPLGAVL